MEYTGDAPRGPRLPGPREQAY